MTPSADRAAFLEDRRQGIGGSDIASVFNLGYGCRLRLWRDKRGQTPDFPREENKAMRLGQVLEPFFAEEYARETDRQVYRHYKPHVHPGFKQLRVNVDRTVYKAGLQDRGVLEIKSVGRAVYYKIKREGLPDDYILQLQAGMLASGSDWSSFAIGSRDSGDLMWWDAGRDETICNRILVEGPAFWALVENGPMPDKLEPDDRRCQRCEYRVTCHGDAFVELAPESDYEQDASLAPLAREYVERRELKAQAEELLEETKNELLIKLGNRRVITEGIKLSASSYVKKEYTVKAHSETRLNVYVGRK